MISAKEASMKTVEQEKDEINKFRKLIEGGLARSIEARYGGVNARVPLSLYTYKYVKGGFFKESYYEVDYSAELLELIDHVKALGYSVKVDFCRMVGKTDLIIRYRDGHLIHVGHPSR